MTTRCDEPMRNKKENVDPSLQDANKWYCSGDCQRCICGLKKNPDGTWSHVNTESKLIGEVRDEQR